MKYLKDEPVSMKKGKIAVTAKPFTNEQQAIIMDMLDDEDMLSRVDMVKYLLRNVVDTIKIGGKVAKADLIADSADLSDPDTIVEFLSIGEMIISEMFVGEEEVKK